MMSAGDLTGCRILALPFQAEAFDAGTQLPLAIASRVIETGFSYGSCQGFIVCDDLEVRKAVL